MRRTRQFVLHAAMAMSMLATQSARAGSATNYSYDALGRLITVQHKTNGAQDGAVTATGGTITFSGSYTIHTFTVSGTFTVQ